MTITDQLNSQSDDSQKHNVFRLVLFNYGVNCIASFVILEQQLIWQAVQEGEEMNILKHGGKMVCIHAEEIYT